MSKGNRYGTKVPMAGGVRPGDYVQFGSDEGGDFDPDLVDYVWGGEEGIAIHLDGIIRWPDGQSSETTYDPDKPPLAVDIIWRGERTTWHLEGAPESVKYETVEDLSVSSDIDRRLVLASIRNLRLTMSPEKCEEIIRRLRYHIDRAKGGGGRR